MQSPYEVDATAAIVHLGIRIPVRFVSADLNDGFDPAVSWMVRRLLVRGRTDLDGLPHYATVLLDWDAIEFAQSFAEKFPDAPKGWSEPRCPIAHELIHVQQQQGCPNGAAADAAYDLASNGRTTVETYETNSYERDAFERERDVSKYIQLIPRRN